ncbi:hypothetical protein R83H12_02685 [Fibrobacteria bacterium R8-3-H12]
MKYKYPASKKNIFLQAADLYLVAYTMAKNCTLVTHELPSNSAKKIKIPNVCTGLGLSFTTPYKMLREPLLGFAKLLNFTLRIRQ